MTDPLRHVCSIMHFLAVWGTRSACLVNYTHKYEPWYSSSAVCVWQLPFVRVVVIWHFHFCRLRYSEVHVSLVDFPFCTMILFQEGSPDSVAQRTKALGPDSSTNSNCIALTRYLVAQTGTTIPLGGCVQRVDGTRVVRYEGLLGCET